MDRDQMRTRYDGEWTQWASTLRSIDAESSRVPGVLGDWSVHDVAGHVHCYHRFHLANVRAALGQTESNPQDWYGPREIADDDGGDVHQRNAAIRVVNLPLTWDQILEEAGFLHREGLAFIDATSDDDLAAKVGWAMPDWVMRRADDGGVNLVNDAWLVALTGGHLGTHMPDVEAWLASRDRS